MGEMTWQRKLSLDTICQIQARQREVKENEEGEGTGKLSYTFSFRCLFRTDKRRGPGKAQDLGFFAHSHFFSRQEKDHATKLKAQLLSRGASFFNNLWSL